MEKRIIAIADTKTQKRYNIETTATTLGELQDEMSSMGIDFTGMSFTEGITKTQLLTRDAQLPTNVMYKGQRTNNLVMLLTNTTKNIASGALTRKEAYAKVKELGLQESILEACGKNYTQVQTKVLEEFIQSASDAGESQNPTEERAVEDGITTAKSENIPNPKEAPHAELVELLYLGIKYLAKKGVLGTEDIAVVASLTGELAARSKETDTGFSEEDIEDIINML